MAVLGSADDDQHAGPVFLQAHVEVDGVRPQVDVALAVQIAFRPGLELLLPNLLEPHDVVGRQADNALTQDRLQRLWEGGGRNSLEVERRDQGVDTGRASQIRRQNRTGEVLVGSTVVHTRLAHRHLPSAGHQLTFLVVAVAHHQALTALTLQLLEALDVLLHLQFQRFLQQPTAAFAQDHLQRRLALSLRYRAMVHNDRRFFHERILLPATTGYGCVCRHPEDTLSSFLTSTTLVARPHDPQLLTITRPSGRWRHELENVARQFMQIK